MATALTGRCSADIWLHLCCAPESDIKVGLTFHQHQQSSPSCEGMGPLTPACVILIVLPQIPCLLVLLSHIAQDVAP